MALVFGGIGIALMLGALVAPCAEALSRQTWSRETLVPSGIVMVLAFLLLSASFWGPALR
jgi:hypothetical protein